MPEPILLGNDVHLANPEHCATWTIEAKTLFAMGANSWPDALLRPVMAMQHFHHVSGADATMYVAAHNWTDKEGRPGTLISLYFASEAAISKSDLESLGVPLSGHGWTYDGVHSAPEYAFPCLALRKGALCYVWVRDEQHGSVCTTLVGSGARARAELRSIRGIDPKRFFPPNVEHAVGVWDAPNQADWQLREQLKLAFAYHVAERVVEADGVVDDDELAFLRRTFPEETLETMWLDDPAMREQLARQAERELKNMLGYHEKLGLLSTFFGACYADGSVAVQELKVLKDASETLGLDRSEVVSYLQKLW